MSGTKGGAVYSWGTSQPAGRVCSSSHMDNKSEIALEGEVARLGEQGAASEQGV